MDPISITPDAVGSGDNECGLTELDDQTPAVPYSKGFLRGGDADNIVHFQRTASEELEDETEEAVEEEVVDTQSEMRSGTDAGNAPATTTATTTTASVSITESSVSAQEARFKGYTGDACPTCAHFTLVRNGTCLKCETCGSTTGCS